MPGPNHHVAPALNGLIFCSHCGGRALDLPLLPMIDGGAVRYRCAGCQDEAVVDERQLLALWQHELRALQLTDPDLRQAERLLAGDAAALQSSRLLSLVGDALALFELADPVDKHALIGFVSERAYWDGRVLEVVWRKPFDLLAQPARPRAEAAADVAHALARLVDAQRAGTRDTLAALERIATALERIAPPPKWLTREQAARHLQISLDTLDRIVKDGAHLEGGPCDFGQGRKMLRFYTDTLDDWYREAGRIQPVAPPQPKRRRRKRKPAPAVTDTPVDWSKV